MSDYIVASLLLAASASDCLQRLTCEAYMQKQLVLRGPLAHARIFFKDLAHLLGLVRGSAALAVSLAAHLADIWLRRQ